MTIRIFILSMLLVITTKGFSQDPNFHIYLCFGQSNMEGQGAIEAADKIVDDRFQVIEAINCSNLGRTKGSWYTAVPPLFRCYTGLSPVDYFGKTLVANLPSEIRIGVVNVAVAGCKIELFDKDNYQVYASTVESWMTNIINEYGGNPYARLVEIAQLAQNEGVIKGILLHQGESNVGDNGWPAKVKGVYDNLILDLGLNPDSVPLLAGEVVHADQGGICAGANTLIAQLPQVISNAHVISSSGCTDGADNLHFNSAGYRELGWRYGVEMLSIMGYETSELVDPRGTSEPPNPAGTESFYFEPECTTIGENWNIETDAGASNGYYVTVRPDMESVASAPAGTENQFAYTFTAEKDSTYYLFGRLNCPTADDDSYWVKMDNGAFVMCNGLATSGWQWMQMTSFVISAGEHTITIAYRENGAKMDKLLISNFSIAPEGMGDEAENGCDPSEPTTGIRIGEAKNMNSLGQNIPNPFSEKTSISFEIPGTTFVSLKVFSILGEELAELAGTEYSSGRHTLEYNPTDLSSGVYFYTLITDRYSSSKKMVLKAQ